VIFEAGNMVGYLIFGFFWHDIGFFVLTFGRTVLLFERVQFIFNS